MKVLCGYLSFHWSDISGDPFYSRTAPDDWEMRDDDAPAYVVSSARLEEIRAQKVSFKDSV